jgi:hypothetical protein
MKRRDFRFGSKADIGYPAGDVRFTPKTKADIGCACLCCARSGYPALSSASLARAATVGAKVRSQFGNHC